MDYFLDRDQWSEQPPEFTNPGVKVSPLKGPSMGCRFGLEISSQGVMPDQGHRRHAPSGSKGGDRLKCLPTDTGCRSARFPKPRATLMSRGATACCRPRM